MAHRCTATHTAGSRSGAPLTSTSEAWFARLPRGPPSLSRRPKKCTQRCLFPSSAEERSVTCGRQSAGSGGALPPRRWRRPSGRLGSLVSSHRPRARWSVSRRVLESPSWRIIWSITNTTMVTFQINIKVTKIAIQSIFFALLALWFGFRPKVLMQFGILAKD